MLTDLFILSIVWYGFGWMGSVLILMMTLFTTTTAYRTLHLEDERNRNNIWRKGVVWLYEYLDFDWIRDEMQDLRLSYPVICLMAFLAMFGTYTTVISFIVSMITFFTVYFWNSIQKQL